MKNPFDTNYYYQQDKSQFLTLVKIVEQHPDDFLDVIYSDSALVGCKHYLIGIFQRAKRFIEKHSIERSEFVRTFVLNGIRVPHQCK